MLNSVHLQGRLTADPELRYKEKGNDDTAWVSFTVACENRPNRDGEKTSEFISCAAFRGTAVFISRYFLKGDTIIIEGKLRGGMRDDRNGGSVYSMSVVVQEANFPGRMHDAGDAPAAPQSSQRRQGSAAASGSSRQGQRGNAQQGRQRSQQGGSRRQQPPTEDEYYSNMAGGWEDPEEELPFM